VAASRSVLLQFAADTSARIDAVRALSRVKTAADDVLRVFERENANFAHSMNIPASLDEAQVALDAHSQFTAMVEVSAPPSKTLQSRTKRAVKTFMDHFTEAMREPAVDRAAVADLNEQVLYGWRHIAAAIDGYMKLCKVSESVCI